MQLRPRFEAFELFRRRVDSSRIRYSAEQPIDI